MKQGLHLLFYGCVLSVLTGFGCAGAVDSGTKEPGTRRTPVRQASLVFDDQVINTAKHADYLSASEKQVIAEINKVRVNPKGYAELFISRAKNCEADCREVARRLRAASPMLPLLPSPELSAAAKEYVERTRLDPVAKADQNFRQRIEKYGLWQGQIAENISYGFSDPVDIVINLLRSDKAGTDRPYSIVNPEFQYAGAAIGLHTSFRFMCVVDFAQEIEQKIHEIKSP